MWGRGLKGPQPYISIMKTNKRILGITTSPIEQKLIDLQKIEEALKQERNVHYGTYIVDKNKNHRMSDYALWSSKSLDMEEALREFSERIDNGIADVSEVSDEILIFQLVGIRKINRKITILPVDSPSKVVNQTDDEDD